MIRTRIPSVAGALICALALTACAGVQDDDAVASAEPVDMASGVCPADQFQLLIGQPRVEIDTASLPRPHRVYGQGDMVTADHRPNRMNVVVGHDGRVEQVRCG